MEDLNNQKGRRFKGLIIALVLIGVVALTAVITVWLAKLYLFPNNFQPVQLSAKEETILDKKIEVLTALSPGTQNMAREKKETPAVNAEAAGNPLAPEPYREIDANRRIRLNERELNALLAKNTDLADKVAIDLSKDMASIKVLIPLDPELPILGGKTLKMTAGLELHHEQEIPTAILKGVSIWGVPIPSAWMGGMKNTDLIKVLGADNSFWQGVAAGIEDLRVEDGLLTIQLAK